MKFEVQKKKKIHSHYVAKSDDQINEIIYIFFSELTENREREVFAKENYCTVGLFLTRQCQNNYILEPKR